MSPLYYWLAATVYAVVASFGCAVIAADEDNDPLWIVISVVFAFMAAESLVEAFP